MGAIHNFLGATATKNKYGNESSAFIRTCNIGPKTMMLMSKMNKENPIKKKGPIKVHPDVLLLG